MDRVTYNNCMRPFMTGSKTKQERQHDMCIGAKICSGKASTEAEAEAICNQPRLPKWAKSLVNKEEGRIGCEDRIERVKESIEFITEKVKAGAAEEVVKEAAQVIQDIHTCLPEPAIVEMVGDAMGQFHDLSKGHYFKGEGREVIRKLATLKEVLV